MSTYEEASAKVSYVFVTVAALTLLFSFCVMDSSLDSSSGENWKPTNACEYLKHHSFTKDDDNKRSRLVFVVIDAWRQSFLTSDSSPMNFTRSLIRNGHAVYFVAHARMPTVTLPRITAYLSGTLPSFGTVLTNFASPEMKVDNWISGARKKGLRIHFFGDDTWIKLFPNDFERSEGVTSFYVNDYVEVDNNVTSHLDRELVSDDWDVLILHYLGLDHIGHSLGGTSSRIPEKLFEMDSIVERILKSQGSQETMVVICGDHGMTESGSHGGASQTESQVPVVVFHTAAKVRNFDENRLKEPIKIEQMDVAATVSSFLSLGESKTSYGVSLLPILNESWVLSDDFLLNDAYLQLRHFYSFASDVEKESLKNRYGNVYFDDVVCPKEEHLRSIAISNIDKDLRRIQKKKIDIATSTSIVPCLAALANLFFSAIIQARSGLIRDVRCGFQLAMSVTFYLSSSLLEEEHEIWYFTSSILIALTMLDEVASLKSLIIKKWKKLDLTRLRKVLSLWLLHRIGFGWMQGTRRRWAMNSVLLPPPIFADYVSFGSLGQIDVKHLCSYLPQAFILVSAVLWTKEVSRRNSKGPIALMCSVFFYQLIQTLELTSCYFHASSLVRVLTLGTFFQNFPAALLSYLLFLSPDHQVLLLYVVYRMGRLAGFLEIEPNVLSSLLLSSFFYMGNSNSLSTIDLAPGYAGIQSYLPAFIAVQLLLNFYAGPIVFILGLLSSEAQTRSSVLELARRAYFQRTIAFISAIASFILFRHHLFLWTVFAPKVVYDMTHALCAALLHFAISISS